MKKNLAAALMVAAFVMCTFAIYAYIPENSTKNSFDAMIVKKSEYATNLIMNGIKEVSKEFVAIHYEGTGAEPGGYGGTVKHAEDSNQDSSEIILYYEAKNEITDAMDEMDEINRWIDMYQTTNAADARTFNKMKKCLVVKDAVLSELWEVLKTRGNKIQVMELKKIIIRADKDFYMHKKLLKGDIILIPGKQLPEQDQ